MFTLPPRPPKDYEIKEVPKTQLSAPELTGDAEPRVTQSNFGIYSYPIQYEDTEAPHLTPEKLNPKVLDIWTNKARAFWVDSPNANACFLHDIFNKYSVKVEDTYNPTYKNKESVFYRPFMYEFDCIENARQQKLRKKVENELGETCSYIESLENKELQVKQEKEEIKVLPCKFPAPFWWEGSKNGGREKMCLPSSDSVEVPEVSKTTYEESFRWQEPPSIIGDDNVGACQRRNDMLLVGQPFQHEACNWYYKNYPPPQINFRPKHFA